MFFIIKDMNFHLHYDKQMTLQSTKASDTSPSIKRIRLISPSPSRSLSPVKMTSVKSNDLSIKIDTADHSFDMMINDPVLILLFFI